ncbi:MAG: GldG family protein [Treponema sp.]|jgi:gliding-associated putative ABC transporter substrate-binding component GldG|nr:GldG family protein [Treponema sp.]
MTKKQQTIITTLTLAIIVLALMLSSRLWFRADFTKNKAYTISKVSQNLYLEIPDQVRITYYISSKLSQVHPMPGEVDDLLREYAAHSHGKIRYTRKDPVKAGLAQAVEQMGIVPQQIQTTENNELSFATVYTGISIEYLDKVDVLPVVFSLDTLEYDLSSRIRSLIRGTAREAGVIVGDSFRTWGQGSYQSFAQSLTQSGITARVLSPGDEIPDALPCLFVLGGAENLDDWALYRIDRYIRGGGKVFFAVDSTYVDVQANLNVRALEDKGLLAMLASYGAVVKPEMVLDKTAHTITVTVESRPGLRQYRMMQYPHWFQVQQNAGAKGHPLTANFSGLDLYWPNPVALADPLPEGVTGTVLFHSTSEAWLETQNFTANIDMAYLFESEKDATRGAKPLGVDLTGVFPSWFEGKPTPTREGSSETLPDMPAEAKSTRIIVVGSSDFAGASEQTTNMTQRNISFLLQAADWLGNDDDMVSIGNRSTEPARLDKILDEGKKKAAQNWVIAINVGLVPFLLLAVGLLVSARRRRYMHGL